MSFKCFYVSMWRAYNKYLINVVVNNYSEWSKKENKECVKGWYDIRWRSGKPSQESSICSKTYYKWGSKSYSCAKAPLKWQKAWGLDTCCVWVCSFFHNFTSSWYCHCISPLGLPQQNITDWLTQQQFYFLISLESGSLKLRYPQGWFLLDL